MRFKFFNRDSRTSKALNQVIYSFFLRGVSILIGFAYVPLLLHYLNDENYGIWLTLTSILSWFSFFDIGLGNGLRNKLTEAIAKNNIDLAKVYISTTYFLMFCIFGVILIIFEFVNPFLNWNRILNANSLNSEELYLLSSIVFSFFILRFIFQLISTLYIANHKSSFSDLITTLGNGISFITIYILIHSNFKSNLILIGGIISIIPVALFIIASIIAFKGEFKKIRPSIKSIKLKYSYDLLSLGSKFFFLQISSIVIFSTSSFFIAHFYGPKEVTKYSIAMKLFQMPTMIYAIILSPIWSAVTEAFTTGDFLWLRKTLKRLNYLSILFSIGTIILFLISNWFYKLWIGNDIQIPPSLSISLAIYTILNVLISPYSNFINGTGKIKLTMYFTAIYMLTYFILVFLFGHIFTNSTGIVLATIFTSMMGGIIEPIQTNKLLKGTAKGIWNK